MRDADAIMAIHMDRGRNAFPLERVYRHLFNPDFFLRAYGKLYRNAGAMTRGVTRETVDGMSVEKVDRIIGLLRDERFRWAPARRTSIPKSNGKQRPLGIPTWSDKVVQEVLRMLLEPYYEPRFSDHSHGFRPGRGVHSALREVRRGWKGTVWFIEGDIKGAFDNVAHSTMLEILAGDGPTSRLGGEGADPNGPAIRDGRLLNLIAGLLDAGYMEDGAARETLSGTPQGGVISPLLFNIYLNELDRFMEREIIPEYTRGGRRKENPEYRKLGSRVHELRRRGKAEEAASLKRDLRGLPSKDGFDPDYRRVRYVRYADDFLVGFVGPKGEAVEIRERVRAFLADKLHLELSLEKTLITHAVDDRAKFLGYEIGVSRANTKLDRGGNRSTNGNISLGMPRTAVEKIRSAYSKGGKVVHRPELGVDSDHAIVSRYQSVLRGHYLFYCMAANLGARMGQVRFVLQESLVKTLAHKHKIHASEVYRRYSKSMDGRTFLEARFEREGKEPLIARFADFPMTRKRDGIIRAVDYSLRSLWFGPGGRRAEVVERMQGGECELCGAVDVRIEMHHIRKLSDLHRDGRKPPVAWRRIMSARRRKTIAVCESCHRDIHSGRYDGIAIR
jgi:retron-type reverse transcriptase